MVCGKCSVDKEATEANFAFRTDAQCLRRTCRDCVKAQRHARLRKDKYGEGEEAYWRYLRKERLRARRSRRKNPEINRRATARWRKKNPEKYRELVRASRARRGNEAYKKWRAANRERFNAYMRDWNKLNKLKGSDANELMDLIAAALPKGLPTEIKDEVTQELIVKVLGGQVRISQIKQQTKPLVTRFYRDYANRALLSLDAPISGFENFTLGETIEG